MKKKQVAECLSRYTSKWRRKKHSPRKGEKQGLTQSHNFLRIANTPHEDAHVILHEHDPRPRPPVPTLTGP